MSERVCFLTSVHPAFDTRIFYKEAKTLAAAGYDVTLVAQHDTDEVVDGIRIVALPKAKSTCTTIASGRKDLSRRACQRTSRR